MLKQKTNDNR